MRSAPLTATVLLSAVIGTVLAVLAPPAVAQPGSRSEPDDSPGNRGWVAGNQHDADDPSDDSGDPAD